MESKEEVRIRAAITDAALSHCELLAQAHNANQKVSAVAADAQVTARQLGASLIKLQVNSQNVAHAGRRWRRERQLLSSAVSQHQKLLALVEAPSLVSECIQNEMYHEALLVLEHVMRSARYAQQVALFKRLLTDVRAALVEGVERVVLPRLGGSVTIDGAFKMVTFLKRLGISQASLRHLFLERRATHLRRLRAEADASLVPYSRALKHIAVYKVHVSEALLQYRACFSDASPQQHLQQTQEVEGETELQEWCHSQAQCFIDALDAAVGAMSSGSELALVVEQCNSCSITVAKVNMSVSAAVETVVLDKVKRIVMEQMATAESTYTTSMLSFSWRAPAAYSSSAQKLAETASTVNANSGPPMALTQWLPLAYALNGTLAVFNSVRKCLVPGIDIFVCESVAHLMRHIAKDLIRDGEMLSTMDVAEQEVYKAFVCAFADIFCPYVIQCTGALLGAHMERWVRCAITGQLLQLIKVLPTSPALEPAPSALPAVEQPVVNRPIISAAPSPQSAQSAAFDE